MKQAFKDKFGSCLEKWEKYCKDIASSKFLMGEIKSFRATLDWALKFDIIQKILEGNYGIGDRARKLTKEELETKPIVYTNAAYQNTREDFIRPEGEEKERCLEYFKTIQVALQTDCSTNKIAA